MVIKKIMTMTIAAFLPLAALANSSVPIDDDASQFGVCATWGLSATLIVSYAQSKNISVSDSIATLYGKRQPYLEELASLGIKLYDKRGTTVAREKAISNFLTGYCYANPPKDGKAIQATK